MKQRFLTAIALLIMVSAFSLITLGETKAISGRIVSYAQDIQQVTDSGGSSEELCQKLENYWNKNYRIICLYTSHRELDNIENQIILLKEYAHQDDSNAIFLYCRKIISSSEQMFNSLIPNIQNIL